MLGRRSALVLVCIAALLVAATPAIGQSALVRSAPAPLDRAPSPPPHPAWEPPGVPDPPLRDDPLPESPADLAGDSAAIPPPPDEFDGPPPSPPAELPEQLRRSAGPAGDGVFAVVIGIDDYPGTSADLHHAVADARAIDEALHRFGVPPDQRLVLHDRDATRATIVMALRWLTELAGPDATAVFFFAGHVRSLGGGTEALVAADGEMVTDVEVAQLLEPLAAARSWIVIAACYGGGFTEVLAPGRVLTAAAAADALAYENRRLGGSYLVHYLVREGWLDGHAGDSVQEAYAYAYHRIAEHHPDRLPVQHDRLGEPLQFVIDDPGHAPPPPSEPPPATERQPEPEPSGAPAGEEEPAARRPPGSSSDGGRRCSLNGIVCRGNP